MCHISPINNLGALVLLLVYMKGWPLEKCISEYEDLARSVFGQSRPKLLNYIFSMFTGALYSSRSVDAAMKGVFGHCKLTDYCYADRVGTRFGVLAATVSQPTICLFTNYNGVGSPRSGYEVPQGYNKAEAWEM